MTTGATRFTRLAGKAGLAGMLFILGAFSEAFNRDPAPWAGWGFGGLWMLAAIGCFLVFSVGLLVRHRGLWWVAPVVFAIVAYVVLMLLGVMASSPLLFGLAGWIGGLAGTGSLLGILLAGELPRRAVVLTLLAGSAQAEGSGVAALASAVLGLVGYVWLAWAMAREPLAGSAPRSEITYWPAVPA